MSYSCIYEDTIFYNPQNKHSIIRVRTKDNSIPNKARKATSSRDDFIRFVAKGYNLPQTSKISMVLEGEWETSKYGTQLNVETCEEIVPHTDEGMKGYLSSCLVKGIITEFNEFKEQQLALSSQDVFENSNRIHFYKEIHLYITDNDLEEIFENNELKILSEYGTSLINLLYEEYLSVENASISNWNAINEIFDLLIEKENENE